MLVAQPLTGSLLMDATWFYLLVLVVLCSMIAQQIGGVHLQLLRRASFQVKPDSLA
jgi:hypothetical protein